MIARAELHELACTGPDDGCVCAKPAKVSALGQNKGVPDWQVVDYATHNGVDIHLSSLESLLIVLEQRQLDGDQLDRFARLLQYGERMALTRARRKVRIAEQVR